MEGAIKRGLTSTIKLGSGSERISCKGHGTPRGSVLAKRISCSAAYLAPEPYIYIYIYMAYPAAPLKFLQGSLHRAGAHIDMDVYIDR